MTTRDALTTDQCAHGSLKRSCEICERDAEIDRLRMQIHEWMVANGPGGWIDNLRKRAGYDPHFAQRAPDDVGADAGK